MPPGDTSIEPALARLIARLTSGAATLVPGSLEPLTGGYDTEVFAFRVAGAGELPERLVLRLFRQAGDTARAVFEATVHNALAGAGLPVPVVFAGYSGETLGGRPLLVMAHVAGTPLTRALADPQILMAVPRLLATAQGRVHDTDTRGLQRSLARCGIDPRTLRGDGMLPVVDAVRASNIEVMRPIVEWLDAHAPSPTAGPVLCHGDFHPGNMLVAAGELTGIVDWGNVKLGRPEFDVGCTTVLIRCGPLAGTGFDESARPMLALAADQYVAAYRELRPLEDGLVRYYATLRATRALVRVRARQAGVAPSFAAPDGYAWDRDEVCRALESLVAGNTGIALG